MEEAIANDDLTQEEQAALEQAHEDSLAGRMEALTNALGAIAEELRLAVRAMCTTTAKIRDELADAFTLGDQTQGDQIVDTEEAIMETNVREREATTNINDYDDHHWQSDWNGDEVGWDHIDVVGLYDILDSGDWRSAYIDATTGDILEWLEDDDE